MTIDTLPPRGLTGEQLDLLLSPLHPSRVRQLSGQSHLEAWDVRRWLTRIFGFCGWSDEILSCQLVHEQFWPVTDQHGKPVPGKNRCTAVYRVTLRLTVKDAAGNVLGSWDDAATGDSVNQPSVGDAHDMALKTAVSQALKRCAVNLGDQFGLSLYNKGTTGAVIVRSAAHGSLGTASAPPQDAPVQGGELDEAREGEPQTQVAEAVARKAEREQRDAPPAEDEFAPEAPSGPRPSTPGQRTKLVILFEHKLQVTDRDQRIAMTAKRLERPITSFTELTFTEAKLAIDELTKMPDAPPVDRPAAPSAPNPRNGDTTPSPAVAAALATPNLSQLIARAAEANSTVGVLLFACITGAQTPKELERLFAVAVQARDGGHLEADEFAELDQLGRAANEDMANGKTRPPQGWSARGMAAMEAKAGASA